ncbi:indole-3-glycerol-phosphate synthase [Mesoterricola silvestris]|uniref:indole-3-glycerol-phosphate synthase n=1 Tax=Mesoterricola silvestris TaxID=2927979 RepID=A0AA48GWU2_9BACT|nr:indole-3-glycerol-phosphate synthase [Mesoterricola silvestris]BDU73321.1 indole-3-glycerol-phosphate synthase [Mesoterricola silvestris]
MAGILETIVERERRRMEGQVFPTPFRARPLRGEGPFERALRRAELPVIAEFKRASPSLGPFALDADLASRLGAYARGGAACFSVLAESQAFGGRPEDIPLALGFGLPVLYKGFVCTRAHLEEACALGAQAVLLIVRVLGGELPAYAAAARALGLEPLVELHDPGEIPAAQACHARLVGWNVRNLADFSEGPADAAPLRRAFPGALLIRESGLRSPELAREALAQGFDALLIGEALMRAPDPAAYLDAVRR